MTSKRESTSAHAAWGVVGGIAAQAIRPLRGPWAGAGVGLALGVGTELAGQAFGWKPDPLDVPSWIVGSVAGALLGGLLRKIG